MINIAEIHRLVKLRLNRLDSNHDQDFLPIDIDTMIDQATLRLIDFVNTNTERTQIMKDILSPFKVSWPDQPELTPDTVTAFDSTSNLYLLDFNLDNLKYEYYKFMRAWVTCKDFSAPLSIITSDEQQKLNNSFIRSNRLWGRYVGMFIKQIDKEKPVLRVYSDGVQDLKLKIEYIKRPKKVFLGGYDSIEYIECKRRNDQYGQSESCSQYYNINSAPVDSELGAGAMELLIDMVVFLLSGVTENQLVLQITNTEISKQQQVM